MLTSARACEADARKLDVVRFGSAAPLRRAVLGVLTPGLVVFCEIELSARSENELRSFLNVTFS